jgi:hypothetical protein
LEGRRIMAEDGDRDEAIHISSDQARGASGSDESTRSATLLPMLIAGIILVLIGVIVAVMISR